MDTQHMSIEKDNRWKTQPYTIKNLLDGSTEPYEWGHYATEGTAKAAITRAKKRETETEIIIVTPEEMQAEIERRSTAQHAVPEASDDATANVEDTDDLPTSEDMEETMLYRTPEYTRRQEQATLQQTQGEDESTNVVADYYIQYQRGKLNLHDYMELSSKAMSSPQPPYTPSPEAVAKNKRIESLLRPNMDTNEVDEIVNRVYREDEENKSATPQQLEVARSVLLALLGKDADTSILEEANVEVHINYGTENDLDGLDDALFFDEDEEFSDSVHNEPRAEYLHNEGMEDARTHYPDVQRDHVKLSDFAETAVRELVDDATEKDAEDFVNGYEIQVVLLDKEQQEKPRNPEPTYYMLNHLKDSEGNDEGWEVTALVDNGELVKHASFSTSQTAVNWMRVEYVRPLRLEPTQFNLHVARVKEQARNAERRMSQRIAT